MKKDKNQDSSSNTVNHVLQSTIKHDVNFEGIGLHSGKTVHMTLSPAPVNTGIIFRRTDLKHIPQLKLCVEGMKEAIMCSKLVSGDESISTIEHLVSAICAFEIDNLYIDIDAPEVPVFDDSSINCLAWFSRRTDIPCVSCSPPSPSNRPVGSHLLTSPFVCSISAL